MTSRAKTVRMPLYDGSLSGMTNLSEKTFSTLIQPVVILGNGRKWTHFSDSFENGRIWAQ